MDITTLMSCSTMMSVTAGARPRKRCAVWRVSSGDIPAVGSSSSRSSGSAASVMAISTRRRSPWDIVPTRSPARSSKPTRASAASTLRTASSRETPRRENGRPERRMRPWTMSDTCSRAVSLGKICEI